MSLASLPWLHLQAYIDMEKQTNNNIYISSNPAIDKYFCFKKMTKNRHDSRNTGIQNCIFMKKIKKFQMTLTLEKINNILLKRT